MSDEAAKHLPQKCQAFRKEYLKGLETLAHQPQKFENRLKESIESAKGHVAPYTSLLLAVLSQNPKQNKILLAALEKRAAVESKLKVNYPYGRAALERIKNGKCVSVKGPAFTELCYGQDLIYERIVALNVSSASNQEMKKK